MSLESELEAIAAETGFSGVIRVDDPDGDSLETAYGLAHRGCGIANEVETRFAVASGAKDLAALAVMSLVEDGTLELATTARCVLGPDLRSSTTASVGHRRLPRRGRGARCTSSRRRRRTSRSSTDTRRSFLPASGSRTATVAPSCWR